MSILPLHSSVVEDYRDFVRSFFTVADTRAREFIDHELLDEARLWPEALLQVSPSYARDASVDDLAARALAPRRKRRIFPAKTAGSRSFSTSIRSRRWIAPVAAKVTSSPAARVQARASPISCPSLMRSCATPPHPTASPRSWFIP